MQVTQELKRRRNSFTVAVIKSLAELGTLWEPKNNL
jgi:hypothetical protein